jgi:peptidoglycan/xylan/chitin deacetylase (PgdA/CDA1 family)
MINLCFHGIGAPERELEADEDQFWVEPERFEALLDAAGELEDVRLTFDDGNRSDVAVALPALMERGLTASFFVVAGRLEEPGSLSGDDVGALAGAGMTIGTHGLRHRPWRSLDESGYREELDEARTILASTAGAPIDEAACPFGAYDRRTLRALRKRGYTRVYTVDRRPAAPQDWLQARYVIRRDDTPETLRAFGNDSLLLAAKTAAKRWR